MTTYSVRIVQADGNPRFLRTGYLCSYDWTRYKTISNARRAAQKYIGDGKHLGQFYADILDNDDEQRSIEI